MTLGQYARQKAIEKGLSAEEISKLIDDIDQSPKIDRDDMIGSSWQEKWAAWAKIVDQMIDEAVKRKEEPNEDSKTEENTERD